MLDKEKLLNGEYSNKDLADFLISQGFNHIILPKANLIEKFAMISLLNNLEETNPPTYKDGDIIEGYDGEKWFVSGYDIRDFNLISEGNSDVWGYYCNRQISKGFRLANKVSSDIKSKIDHIDKY